MTSTLSQPALPVLEQIVRVALLEDIARGDVTSESTVASDTLGAANFRARHELVLSGVPLIRETFRQVDPSVEVEVLRQDGELLQKGDIAVRIRGRARSLLLGERVALNFAQRMSGVATQAKRYVDALTPGSTTRVTDTRKTTPGLRALERYAVRCGGAHNHREDLSSAVLIKDNHIAAAGGVRIAILRARDYAPHTSRIECEVDSLSQLQEALDAKADIIMLDNFDDAMVKEGLALAKGRAVLEVSGGITLPRIATLSALGVDIISVGALTHSAPAVDLGLDWANE